MRLAAAIVASACTILSLGPSDGVSRTHATPTLAFVNLTGGLALTTTGLVQQPLLRTRNVGEFEWSPDGLKIAYFGAAGALYVIGADGSGLRKLPAKAITSGLAWSPDSRRLAYTGLAGTSVGIYVIGASGGTPRLLVPSVPGSALATWSSRGMIAFGSVRTDRAHIYSVRPDGTGLRTLVRNASDAFPSWSPDGRMLLFQHSDCADGMCGVALSVVRQDGSGRRRVALLPHRSIGHLSTTWSPDSRRIAFERPHAASFDSDLVRVDVNGSDLRNLTKGALDGESPAWSPDGRWIAFGSSRSIYLMNADGSNRRRYLDGAGRPAWKPR